MYLPLTFGYLPRGFYQNTRVMLSMMMSMQQDVTRGQHWIVLWAGQQATRSTAQSRWDSARL